MNKKVSMFTGVALSLSLVLSGCNSDKAPENASKDNPTPANEVKGEPKILKLNNHSNPGSLHPGLAQGTHDSWPMEHMMEGLLRKGPDGKPVAGISKEWSISEDGKTFTFKLQDGLKWSNGEPLTAHDFEYAWKYVLTPATASQYAYMLYYIEGAEAYNTSTEKDAGKLKTLEDKVGVKALDDTTLEVKLVNPTPFFLDLTTHYTYYPVSQKVQEANKDWANKAETYVSNGPFKLAEWKPQDSIKLVKNEYYYDADKVKLDGIDFAMIEDDNTAYSMYEAGELDHVYPVPTDALSQLKDANNPEFKVDPDLAVYYYNFNTTKKPFNNVKVRKAFAMAIDRKGITENVSQGGQKPAFGIVPGGIPDSQGDFQQNSGDLFKEDVAEAKKLLAEGLKEEGMDKFPATTLLYNTSEAHKKIAEAVQQMWKANLGVDINLENQEFQVKIDREQKLDFQISRAGWVGDYVDPSTFIDLFHSKSQQNNTGWKNAQFDQLVDESKVAKDPAERMKKLHEAEKILMQDMPIAPIYFYTKPQVQKPYVKDAVQIVNRYTQFQFADLQK